MNQYISALYRNKSLYIQGALLTFICVYLAKNINAPYSYLFWGVAAIGVIGLLLNLIATAIYPNADIETDIKQDVVGDNQELTDKEKKSFYRVWLAFAGLGGLLGLVFGGMAVYGLFESNGNTLIPVMYLCLSVLCYGFFVSIKDLKMSRNFIVVGSLGAITCFITTLLI